MVSSAPELTAVGAAFPAGGGRGATTRRAPWPLAVGGLAIGLLFAVPLAYLASESLARDVDVVEILRSEDALAPLVRTLTLAVGVAALATALGTALAWLTTRTDLPGRRLWRLVVPLPLVIPSFVGALALIAAFAPDGVFDLLFGFDRSPRIEGYWWSVTLLGLLTYPYVYLPVAARLAALPTSLEESARALGRSPWGSFRTVVLPQLTGAMWAGALLVFLYSLSEFGAVQLLHYDTLTRAIYSARLLDRDTSIVLSLLLATVALVVVITERVHARRRVLTEAVGRARPALTPLGRWRWPAVGFVASVVGVALVGPVIVLVQWTLRGVAGDVALHADRLVTDGWTTAWLGLVTAFVAVAVVLPVAFLTTRHRSWAGGAANTLVVSGFALPGLVVALALVFFVLQVPAFGSLYQTYSLLIAAYVVHFGSQAMRASQVAVSGVPRRVDDAARSLGASRMRRLVTVDLPLMRGGLAAGMGLVLLSTMKELPATLVLRPLGSDTLATRIWASASEGFYAEAGLAALVLLVLSGLLTWFLTIRRAEFA
ncbi:MAG TPA: iron ABC transporter permease [Acidimicrobiia bacterium]|nr:iron ABC transporter permease [Acidimicrobiia bacterium]